MRGVTVVPWTDEERAQLRRLCENGLGRKQIAALLGRTAYSVNRQMHSLGLRARDRDPPRSRSPNTHPTHATMPRAGRVTLPPLPSLMDSDPS